MPKNSGSQDDDFDVTVTVRMRIPKKDNMYVRNGEIRTDLVQAHAVYVLDRVDPNPKVEIEVKNSTEKLGETE